MRHHFAGHETVVERVEPATVAMKAESEAKWFQAVNNECNRSNRATTTGKCGTQLQQCLNQLRALGAQPTLAALKMLMVELRELRRHLVQ
jgi:hypothetical protein